jgi:hypothetical protein
MKMTQYDFNNLAEEMTTMTTNDHKGNSAESAGVVIFPPPGGGGNATPFDHCGKLKAFDASESARALKLGDAQQIAPETPARLSNFDQATFSVMTQLREIDAQIEQLTCRKTELRGELQKALAASDEGKASFDGLGTASLAAGAAKVIVLDVAKVPERFVKREPTVDTTAAGKALRAGGEVAGLTLGEAGDPVLRIVWVKPDAVVQS